MNLLRLRRSLHDFVGIEPNSGLQMLYAKPVCNQITPLIMQFSGNRSRITQFAFTEVACQALHPLDVFKAYNIVTRSVTCKSSSSCALPYTVLSVRITGTLRRTTGPRGPRAITICHTLPFVSMLGTAKCAVMLK